MPRRAAESDEPTRSDDSPKWEERKVTMKVRKIGRWLQVIIGDQKFIMRKVDSFEDNEIPF